MKKLFTFFFVGLIALSLFACKDETPAEDTAGVGYGLVHGHYVGKVDVKINADGEVTEASVEEYFLPYNWAKVEATATATGYGLVHGHYVGVIDVTIDQAGLVTDASVEEYFLPYNWAKVAVADTENVPADVVTVVGSRGTSYYAMYVDIDGVLFTGTAAGESGAQHIVYSATGIDDLEVWVEDAANAKAYVEAVEAGNYFIANQDGTESSYTRSDATSNTSMKKSESGYWSGDNYPLGWAGNMEAFVTGITGTKLSAALETIVKDGTWSIGTIVTGATMTDFVDYYEVAQRGYANALTAFADDVVAVIGSRGLSVYAKYIKVGDTLYTAAVSGAAGSQSVVYSATGIANIEAWVETEANAKAYVEIVEAGNFYVANADGSQSSLTRADATSNTSMKKSESGYWSGTNYPLGWAGNMAEFVTGITGTKLDAQVTDIVKDTTWSIGTIATGATMTDFVDYYEVAQRAHADAVSNQE